MRYQPLDKSLGDDQSRSRQRLAQTPPTVRPEQIVEELRTERRGIGQKNEIIAPEGMADATFLSADVVDGFVKGFLVQGFDNPLPTPQFHRDLWTLASSNQRYVAIAAPRGFGKSTTVTHAFTLAAMLFRVRSFGLILSATWDQSCEFLRDIADELRNNEAIHQVFGVVEFIKDAVDDKIVRVGGYEFRLIGRGSGQDNVRGIKWRGKRPDLILGDDLEKDDQVASAERREKFRNWLFNAVLPCGSDDAWFRIVGTVMHYDSALERLLNDDTWASARFRAHAGFDDFTELLWPEKRNEDDLRAIRQRYLNQGNPEGYSQEYLNEPIAEGNEFFRPEDMRPMLPIDYDRPVTWYAAADFAIGRKRRNDFTVIGAAALDADNYLSVRDVRRGRWDTVGIVDELLSVQQRYDPALFGMEKGHIYMTLEPYLQEAMRKRGLYINTHLITPTEDKPARATSFRGMLRAGAIKFDKSASWWPGLEDEMRKFSHTGAKSGHDDQVDMLSILGMMIAQAVRPQTPEEQEEEAFEEYQFIYGRQGVNPRTGY